MDPKLFKPSIDWSAATTDSLWWLAKGWVIAAVCVLVVLVLLRFLTPWGRQFWRITGGYFTGRHAVRTWLQLAVLLLLVLLSVRLTVLFSFQSNDMFTSLQTAFEGIATGNRVSNSLAIHGFWMSLVHFSVLAAIFIARIHARHLSDPAVHHLLAYLADRSPHRRLADGTGLLPGPVHRQHH